MDDMQSEFVDAINRCLQLTDSLISAGKSRGYSRDRVLGAIEGTLACAGAFQGTATHQHVMTHFNLIWPED